MGSSSACGTVTSAEAASAHDPTAATTSAPSPLATLDASASATAAPPVAVAVAAAAAAPVAPPAVAAPMSSSSSSTRARAARAMQEPGSEVHPATGARLLEATLGLDSLLHQEVIELQKALRKSVDGALLEHSTHQDSVLAQHTKTAKRLNAGATTSIVSIDAAVPSELEKEVFSLVPSDAFSFPAHRPASAAPAASSPARATRDAKASEMAPGKAQLDNTEATEGLADSLQKEIGELQEVIHRSVDGAFRNHLKHQEEVLKRHIETVKRICAGSKGPNANIVSIDGPEFTEVSEATRRWPSTPVSTHLEEGKVLAAGKDSTVEFPEEVRVSPSWNRASLSDLATRGNTFMESQVRWGRSTGAKFLISIDHGSWRHQKLYQVFGSWLEFFWGLEEPPRTSLLAKFVDGSLFSNLSAVVIMMNAVQSAISANEQIAGRSISGPIHAWEIAFMIFYTVELGLKLWVHRLYFFMNSDRWWNVFDCALVTLGLFDVISTLDSDAGSAGSTQFAFLRMLRVLRAGRALRSLRALRAVTELRTLLTSVVKSVASLFWSVCMIVFIYYIFSLIIVQVSIAYDDFPQAEFLEHFGSVQQSMLTLFILSLGGGDLQNFYDFVDPDLNRVIIVIFMLLFQITLLNILTGVYVEVAMKYAQPHRSVRAKALQVQEFEDAEELWAFFASNFSEGEISPEELTDFMKRSSNEAFIETFDIHLEPELMYRHILEKEGQVNIEGLVKFILWHRGPMTKMDILRTDRLLRDMRGAVASKTTTIMPAVEEELSRPSELAFPKPTPVEGLSSSPQHVTLVVPPPSLDASQMEPPPANGAALPLASEERTSEKVVAFPRPSRPSEVYVSQAWDRASFCNLAARGSTFLETTGRFGSKRNTRALFQLHIEHGSWTHRKLYECFGSWLEFFWDLEEPPRSGGLADFVDGSLFAQISAVVILLNAVQSAMAANEQIADRPISGFLHAWEMGFIIFYSVELGLKLWVHRFFFFLNSDSWWNTFDCVLVALALFDLISALDGEDSSGTTQFAFLRMLRILRAGRALRSLRALRAVTELRTLLTSVVKSVASLFWSVCMILFIYYIFSLIIVQVSIAYEDSPTDDFLEHFGSVQKSMLTLFILSLGGGDLQNFYDFLDPTLNKVIICMFVLLFQITLLNILTGVYVEAAMKYAQPHRTARAKALQVQEFEEAEELWAFFAANLPSDEGITRKTLAEFLQRPTNESFMETFDITVDPDLMYHDIMEREGKVTLEGLVRFVLWNRGPMTKMDILRTNRNLQEMRRWIRTSSRPSCAVQARSSELSHHPAGSRVGTENAVEEDEERASSTRVDGGQEVVVARTSAPEDSDEWVGLVPSSVAPPAYAL